MEYACLSSSDSTQGQARYSAWGSTWVSAHDRCSTPIPPTSAKLERQDFVIQTWANVVAEEDRTLWHFREEMLHCRLSEDMLQGRLNCSTAFATPLAIEESVRAIEIVKSPARSCLLFSSLQKICPYAGQDLEFGGHIRETAAKVLLNHPPRSPV